MKQQTILPTLALASLVTSQYVWPSPQDEIEDLLSLQSGYLRRGFIDGVTNCGFGTNVQGRQNSAEWIRAAFHDTITHNAYDGTGGLDASIFFELDRAENPGTAFNDTFAFFSGFYSVRASASDLLAMSVAVASFSCGGSKIPFRAGRIDAQQAGAAGVPDPHTDLVHTREVFAKAGFPTQDMITMVACGHSLGGVHSTDFPDIVGVEADPNHDIVAHFDTEFANFDNGVVTEYLAGTTRNPLVVDKNDTLNSDKRIFSADGNATMYRLADPTTFQSECADILTRLIDTVPAGVSLTDPIEATDVKPYIYGLYLNADGSLEFSGRIRIRTTSGSGHDPSDLAVQLTYLDRNGNTNQWVIKTVVATQNGGASYGLWGETFLWFEFNNSLDADAGISRFYIDVMKPSTGDKVTYDNAGHGYPAGDALLYQQPESCLDVTAQAGGEFPLTVTALVRSDRVPAAGGLTLDLVRKVARQGVIVPQLAAKTFEFQPTGESRGLWYVYKASAQVEVDSWSTTFDIELAGDYPAKVAFQQTGALTGNTCA